VIITAIDLIINCVSTVVFAVIFVAYLLHANPLRPKIEALAIGIMCVIFAAKATGIMFN